MLKQIKSLPAVWSAQTEFGGGVRLFVALAVAAWGVSACGDDGATVTIKLMDAPPQNVTAVKIFVKSADVHVVDADKAKDADPNDASIDADDKWSSLAVDKEIDLVAHQGESAALALGDLSLPAGKITQIRLQLDLSKPQTVTQNGVDCAMETDLVPETGIKINHPFKAIDAAGGSASETLIDFDLAESLVAAGNCFRLKPVLKLTKVKTDGKDVAL
ncbi:MAG: DUF4382 domain-containing protein [Deltaproteobacteria bacterium]|nr:DUF4382 domain-containing protein [Deltaproteobacteria bacterium]